ncbi:DoxX family protein [Candidatus Parcubacteria bacterium]|nr:DoxX family protein [Candidatus Parcubacteria bacterium]
MLNTFPSLLTYSLLAPFILRLTIGFIFVDLGILKFKSERARTIESLRALGLPSPENLALIYGAVQFIGGVMLIIGLYTQIAALVFVILGALEFYIEWTEREVLKRDIVFYLLMLAIALSILITGAGRFAFDIPL